jgi:hypothetical protein
MKTLTEKETYDEAGQLPFATRTSSDAAFSLNHVGNITMVNSHMASIHLYA